MLVRKDVRFVGRCLDAKAWARRFTLPARGNVLPMATSPQESDFAPLGLAISRPVKIFRSSVENG
jgi:hypothetical protein